MIHIKAVMLQKLKEDLKRLPDDSGFEDYDDMPVEGFGAALLTGHGWYDGRGIGRNAKEDVKIVQYERRTAKEALGFIDDVPSDNNRSNNSTKKKEKEQMNGRGEEQEPRFCVGKDVRIIGGRDVGLKGRIVAVRGCGDLVILRLSKSEEEVKLRICDLAELGSVEEERCLRKLKELNVRGSNDEMGGLDLHRVKDSSSTRSHGESKEEGIQKKLKDIKRSREEGRSDHVRSKEEGILNIALHFSLCLGRLLNLVVSL